MLIYDTSSENLIKKLGNDAYLKFVESYTNLEFYATNYQMTVANEQMNKKLSIDYYVTLEDFLSNFTIPINYISAIPKTDLECGWNYLCQENWGTCWLDFFIQCVEENGELKFVITYFDTPCIGCDKCDGIDCDYYQSGDYLKENPPQ